MVDGDEFDVPPGTLVRVDPSAHREAVALEAGTAVLALGGGSRFEVGASEWIERARPHIHDAPARAGEIIDELRRELPGDRAIDVGEALLAVGQGNDARARAIVAGLVDVNPQLRDILEQDPDLRALLPR